MELPIHAELRDLDGETFAIVIEELEAEVEFLIDPEHWPALREMCDKAYEHWKEVK